MKYSSSRTPFIAITVYEDRNYFCVNARARSEFFPAEISAGPPMSLSVLTIFALPNIFLAPRAHQILLLRRLARFPVVGVLLLKLPSIVRWGGAGRLLLQDEACALYNATAQPRAQGPKEIHGNIRPSLPQFPYNSFFEASRLNLFPRK